MSTMREISVIGAGPAGLITVSRILDTDSTSKINWFDPSFKGGRLQIYSEVPSNTKVSLFIQFAKVSNSLNSILESTSSEGGKSTELEILQSLDQDKGCNLKFAQEFCAFLIQQLRIKFSNRINCFEGWITDINYKPNENFDLCFNSGAVDNFKSDVHLTNSEAKLFSNQSKLFLCTGSEPIPELVSRPHVKFSKSNPPKLLDLDVALNPSKLKTCLSKENVVAVVGSSHSAILCLKNLSELKDRPKIVNFYLSPLRYAEYKDGWILYDNTGLKQMAATWAKENLSSDEKALKIGIQRVLVKDEAKTYSEHIPEVTHICYCVGFKRRFLLKIKVNGVEVETLYYNNKTARLILNGKELNNGYGFGIAFPEEVVDKVGNVETSVGIWKFSNYIKKVIN